jgi:hypothetical protein
MTIVGSQTGADGACGKLYPARMRASGLGALGIGRQLYAMRGVD